MLMVWVGSLTFCLSYVQILSCMVVVQWSQWWRRRFVWQLLWLFDVVVGMIKDSCYIQ